MKPSKRSLCCGNLRNGAFIRDGIRHLNPLSAEPLERCDHNANVLSQQKPQAIPSDNVRLQSWMQWVLRYIQSHRFRVEEAGSIAAVFRDSLFV
mmetsp:Transcript_72367/g.183081  ORF Transcript_72367/g.183081 Transcript_72367/m.183081 type:complete len:94 (+) Transcript_72367:230-511(+)